MHKPKQDNQEKASHSTGMFLPREYKERERERELSLSLSMRKRKGGESQLPLSLCFCSVFLAGEKRMSERAPSLSFYLRERERESTLFLLYLSELRLVERT
jgi:hypothetical protein